MTVTTDPTGAALPGGSLQYRFQLVNGDSMTTIPLTATDTIPTGTVLVPQSQTCGTAGGACTETSQGQTLQWEIPPGAPPKGLFIFSFIVSVASDNPPPEISNGLTFSGPGCPPDTTCTFDAPTVSVNATSGRPGPAWPPAQWVSAADDNRSNETTTTNPATTANPAYDNQNLVVQVPGCSKSESEKKKPECPEISPGRGSGAEAGGQTNPTNGSGANPPSKERSELAHTGDNQVLDLEAGLLFLLAGTSLVIASTLTAGVRGLTHSPTKPLPAPLPTVLGIALNRGDDDFTDEEVGLLDAVRPHLVQAYRNAQLITEHRHALDRVTGALEEEGRAFHVVGEPLAGPAQLLLARHYGLPSDGLPRPVQAWMEQEQASFACSEPDRLCQPMISVRDGRRLTVRFVPGGNGPDLIWLVERVSEPDATPLQRLGLSEREAEVLWFLTKGKSTSEIARDLGISTGTVKKHLEHVYRKLGVSSATAAAAQAFDVLATE
jgi:DNA-binding CsgD family transcriptional regulator